MTTATAKRQAEYENVVHRDEFLTFAKSTDQRFSSIEGSLDKFHNKLDIIVASNQESKKPNYRLLLSLCGFIVLLVSMGSSLTWIIMQSNANVAQLRSDHAKEISSQNDKSIKDHLFFVENGNNRFTRNEFQYERDKIEASIARNSEEIQDIAILATKSYEILKYHLSIDTLDKGGSNGNFEE